jgi:3-oxoacyl-[acyl-carrier protein] reductase
MLAGRVAVVTGSGRGLGRAYARALAAAGAAVVVNDLDGEVATSTVEQIVAAGGRATAVVAPVGPAETADELVATAVAEFGRLDVMVTNAGALRDKTLRNTTDDDFDLVVGSHLRGTFTCGRAAAARFREQGGGGRLILVGSPAGQRASFGQTAYSASKAAIVGLARTWAVELERQQVTVNAIVPTALTRMVATMPGMADHVAAVDRGEQVDPALRRQGLGSPDDVAPLVVWLASDAAAHVTGQVLGAGGDRLAVWCHPTEMLTLLRDGGWTVADVDQALGPALRRRPQEFRQALPELPADVTPEAATAGVTATVAHGVDGLKELVGRPLGPSNWVEVTQERVNGFADATQDHQWIHVDPDRAASGPFGGPIAHGYLTLSLTPVVLTEILDVQGFSLVVNYGCDRVRFPSPVPVGSRVRATAVIDQVSDVAGGTGGVQACVTLTFQAEHAPKPACVASVVIRYSS